MRDYWVRHCDAIIETIIVGLFAISVWRRRKTFLDSPDRWKRAIPGGTIILLSLSVYRLFVGYPVAYNWQRISTNDGVASVEFPIPPSSSSGTQTFGGVTIQRETIKCQVPYKRIILYLSCVEYPHGELVLQDGLESIKASLKAQGVAITSSQPEKLGNNEGYRFTFEATDGDQKGSSLLVAVSNKLYRAFVVTSPATQADPEVERFLGSFQIHPK